MALLKWKMKRLYVVLYNRLYWVWWIMGFVDPDYKKSWY